MELREKARLDLDYRLGKVKSTRENKDKLTQKGKNESPKETEQRLEYERKLEEAQLNFVSHNAQLVADLTYLFDNR